MQPFNCQKYPLVRDVFGNLRATFFVWEMLEGFFASEGGSCHRGFTIVLIFVFYFLPDLWKISTIQDNSSNELQDRKMSFLPQFRSGNFLGRGMVPGKLAPHLGTPLFSSETATAFFELWKMRADSIDQFGICSALRTSRLFFCAARRAFCAIVYKQLLHSCRAKSRQTCELSDIDAYMQRLSGSHRSTRIASDLASQALASQAKPQRESESQAFRIARP